MTPLTKGRLRVPEGTVGVLSLALFQIPGNL